MLGKSGPDFGHVSKVLFYPYKMLGIHAYLLYKLELYNYTTLQERQHEEQNNVATYAFTCNKKLLTAQGQRTKIKQKNA